MLLISYIRDNKDEAIARLSKRNLDAKKIIDEVLMIDEQKRKLQQERDILLAQSNAIARQIGNLLKEGKKEEAEKLRAESNAIKQKTKTIEDAVAHSEKTLIDLLSAVPNLPYTSVPVGKDSSANEIVYVHNDISHFADNLKPHWEIAQQYGIISFDLGSKITGSGFPVYIGQGARLQRALINYFLDKAVAAGYQEIVPPCLVNADSAFGTGQLPDKDEQMYYVQADGLYIIPTAEVPLTNIYREKILREEDLPIKLTAYTPCFRREAGSYGKEVRGLNRIHQFDKVEIVQIQHPDKSYETLEEMRTYVEGLLKELELPYRSVRLCSGDLGFASAMTYDIEVYSAAQKRWLEVSSVSNFESFQSNRMSLRIKSRNKTLPAHTLNGSALALPRLVAALLENNQKRDHITVPKVLHPYTGFSIIISEKK